MLIFFIGVGNHPRSEDILRSIDKSYCDTVLNFLVRLACQVNDPQPGIMSAGENLSRRYELNNLFIWLKLHQISLIKKLSWQNF